MLGEDNQMVYEKAELLPCPFCGVIPKLYPQFDDESCWDVWCGTAGCYLEYGADWCNTREDAIEMWNTRK